MTSERRASVHCGSPAAGCESPFHRNPVPEPDSDLGAGLGSLIVAASCFSPFWLVQAPGLLGSARRAGEIHDGRPAAGVYGGIVRRLRLLLVKGCV